MLKTLDRFKNAEVRRSRDPKVWAECDVVVDVGGEYKVDAGSPMILDHHQRGFTLVLSDIRTELKEQAWASRTKLSSAGLVYAHFGQEILKNLTDNEIDANNSDFQSRLYKHCYEKLIEEVDAIDNGIDQYSGDNLIRNYATTTGLASRVAHLNPEWNEISPDFDRNFPKANEICLEEFLNRVRGFQLFWKAREIVVKAVDNRHEIDEQGRLIDFTELQFCPWKRHLKELEEENYLPAGQVLFCLYKGSSGDKDFRIQAVGKEEGSFANRKDLPESWRGKRGDDFCKATGQADVNFCHAGAFLCGTHSRESQIALAKMALEN